ncbi:hypothetical protein [Methylobacterium brachiatum]
MLRIPMREITSRFYHEIPVAEGELQAVSFFGAHIPAIFRVPVRRRVGPKAMAISGRHQALWELRPFTYDATTMQLLVDRCQNPACMKFLGWHQTRGLHRCEHCNADIREFVSGYVDWADRDACAFAAELVSPVQSARELARARLPEVLQDWNPGTVLDLIVRLSFLHDPKVVPVEAEHSWASVARGVWSAADLARGARLLLDWPQSLHKLIDRVRGEAHTRSGAYGVAKELGSISVFMTNANNPLKYRNLVRSEVDIYYKNVQDVVLRAPDKKANGDIAGYYTMERTAKACNVTVRMLRRVLGHKETKLIRANNADRSPFMFNLEQIKRWNERRLQLIGSLDAQNMLGIPEYTLLHLVNRAVLTRDIGPAAMMMGCIKRNVWLERKEVEDLVKRLECLGVRRRKIPEGSTLLPHLLESSVGLAPWNDIIDGVLDGYIDIRGVLIGSSGVASRLIIDSAEGSYGEQRLKLQDTDADPDDLMSTNAAAALLGTTQVAITWLMNAGFIKGLKTGQNRRRPIRQSVYEFRRTFMLGGEVCRRTGIHKRILSIQMAKSGVYPAAILEDGGRTIWHRSSIDNLIENNIDNSIKTVSGNWISR